MTDTERIIQLEKDLTALTNHLAHIAQMVERMAKLQGDTFTTVANAIESLTAVANAIEALRKETQCDPNTILLRELYRS